MICKDYWVLYLEMSRHVIHLKSSSLHDICLTMQIYSPDVILYLIFLQLWYKLWVLCLTSSYVMALEKAFNFCIALKYWNVIYVSRTLPENMMFSSSGFFFFMADKVTMTLGNISIFSNNVLCVIQSFGIPLMLQPQGIIYSLRLKHVVIKI